MPAGHSHGLDVVGPPTFQLLTRLAWMIQMVTDWPHPNIIRSERGPLTVCLDMLVEAQEE